MVEGTIRVFLGEMLLLPTGLLTAAYLTRKLAPEGMAYPYQRRWSPDRLEHRQSLLVRF